jgi:hypothetical protein
MIKLERMKKEKGSCLVVLLPPDTLGKELTEIISMKRYLIHHASNLLFNQ